MGPMVFVMAIMGCGDGNAPCVQARVAPTTYASMAQCRAALPAALAANTDIDYPSVAAECRATGPMIVTAEAKSRQG